MGACKWRKSLQQDVTMSRALRHLGGQRLERLLHFSAGPAAPSQLRPLCFPPRAARQPSQHPCTRLFPARLLLLRRVCRTTTAYLARLSFAPLPPNTGFPPGAALPSLSEREGVFAAGGPDCLAFFHSSSAAFTAAACASSISRMLAAARWFEGLKLTTCRASSAHCDVPSI